MRGSIRRAFLSVAVVALTLGSAVLASAAPTPPKGPPSGGGPATDVTCTGCVETTDLGAGAVTDAKVSDVGADKITGTLAAASIPSLDASAIGSGTFDAARIPSLDAGVITTGTFGASLIPNLDASIINAGTFDAARIPSLNASKIDAGTFDAARIPSLNASKIDAGTLDAARIPDLDATKITSGAFPGARLAEGSVTTAKQTANATTAGTVSSAILTGTSVGSATLEIGETAAHAVLVAAHAQVEFTGSTLGSVDYALERSEDGVTWVPTTMGGIFTVKGETGEKTPISLTLTDGVASDDVHYRLVVSSTNATVTNGLITLVDLGRS